LFSSPENRVSIVKLGKFASEIARLTGRPDLGLLIAKSYGPHSLGIIVTLAGEGPDVRTALLNIARLLKHHNEFAFLSLSEMESDAILSYELRETGFEGDDIVLVTAIGNAFRVMRRFCGDAWRPAEVRLSMARPRNVTPYETFFGAPVRFESAMDALVFTRHWLDHPVTPDSSASGSGSLPPSAWNFADHVRHQIAMRIGREPVTARAIAAAMGLSRRTLDRRLSGLGVSFTRLVDDIRFARARRLLAVGHAPLSDISLALGYAEPSAFSRAFRGWAGCSPQDWRLYRERTVPPEK
jgi:AraC-like DNA-binding protein